MREAGHAVRVVRADPRMVKLTHAEDELLIATLLERDRQMRTGTGYDVHRLEPGDGVRLCGVTIPCDLRLVGHSDADVALHAAVDAILGALGEGDIGSHFPPSDPQWRGADSALFLRHAMALVQARGGVLDHLDLTIIAERPRIAPHREVMRARLAELAERPLTSISVKATTTEGLGFTGRGEGIAVQALATLSLPRADFGS